ncbi:MAG: IscS subfamily cysteine desulfurase, partial [Pseudomonadales bacterium]
AIGKTPVDMQTMKIDLFSMSAHKAYGPKGIGALFVRRKPRVRLKAEQHGGGHERGMRSGTLPTHQIVGMGEAFALAKAEYEQNHAHAKKLRKKLWDGLQDIEEIYLNGHMEHSIPNTINISFNFIEGESLMMSLKDLAVSSGSACTSSTLEPSYVLRAIGRPDELAHSSIRFSFGKYTTEEDIDIVIEQIHQAVEKIRDLSPLWDMYKEGIDLDTVEWTEH